MYINKNKAMQIARQLTAAKSEQLEKRRKSVAEAVRKLYVDQLPPAVKRLHKEAPAFLNMSEDITLKTGKIDTGTRRVVRVYPARGVPCTSDGRAELKCTGRQAEMIKKDLTSLDGENNEINSLTRQIAATLSRLRTYKRIQKEFPEAAALLNIPEEIKEVVNDSSIVDLRKKLK